MLLARLPLLAVRLGLLLGEIVLAGELLVKGRADAGKGEAFGHVSLLVPGLDLVLEYHQFHLHFRVYVPFFVARPEAPERIADNVPLTSFFLFSKDVLAKLHEDILPLHQLRLFFLGTFRIGILSLQSIL